MKISIVLASLAVFIVSSCASPRPIATTADRPIVEAEEDASRGAPYAPTASASGHRATVEAIADAVARGYAVPELALRMTTMLRERLESGAYEGLSAPELAEQVDEDLRSIAHDQHMMLMYSMTQLALHMGKPVSIVDPPADPEEAQYTNDGLVKIERLPGNVGYVKLERFFPPNEAADTIGSAMNAVASTDALIIDLSDNVGGHPRTVAFLCSYFFEHRTHLNDIVDRENDRTTSFWTDPDVPGQRYLSKPLYVIVGADSFSAAEELAYDLQVLKRATIVGQRTAGAANPSRPVRIDDHLILYLPTGRAVNPITKTNWEGVGVKPDIVAEPRDAVRTAHIAALNALLTRAPTDIHVADRKQALIAAQGQN